jgi:hypothetical protein
MSDGTTAVVSTSTLKAGSRSVCVEAEIKEKSFVSSQLIAVRG